MQLTLWLHPCQVTSGSNHRCEAPQVPEGAASASDAMEVDNAAPKKKEASRSSSRAVKKTSKPSTRSSTKEAEEETPAIATLPAV